MTKLTAHSGCDGRPDNSLQFLEYAFSLNIDVAEVDVRMGADGILYLSHDEEPRTTLLKDALLLLKSHRDKMLNCDLKQENLEAATAALAEEYSVSEQIIFSGTVSAPTMKKQPELFKNVDWYINLELIFPNIYNREMAKSRSLLSAAAMADKAEKYLREYHGRCINAHHGLRDTPLYRELMERGVPLSLWTVNEPDNIMFFLEQGIYNITTRNAAKAAELRDAFTGEGGRA